MPRPGSRNSESATSYKHKKTGQKMNLRRIIASLLLAVYATSVLGYAATIILCHCPQSEHFRSHHHSAHVNASCCHHHHSTASGIHAQNGCNCAHKHTTEIDLYDKTRIADALVKPLVCNALAEMLSPLDTSLPSNGENAYFQLKIPLPEQPLSALAALRAPPVKA